MAVSTDSSTDVATESSASSPTLIDPRAPRFGQAITATGLGLGVVFGLPVLVYAVAVVLLLAVGSGWRLDAYAVAFRRLVRPALGEAEPEPAAPHRFARVMGAVGTALASGLLLAGLAPAGYVVAAAVAALAGLAAVTGICVGCRLYRQVQFVRRLGLV